MHDYDREGVNCASRATAHRKLHTHTSKLQTCTTPSVNYRLATRTATRQRPRQSTSGCTLTPSPGSHIATATARAHAQNSSGNWWVNVTISAYMPRSEQCKEAGQGD